MPLLEPGDELEEAREEGGEAIGAPAVLGLALLVEAGEGGGALEVVPPGPAEERARVVVLLGAGIGDEALLRDVELAAEAVVIGVAEVLGVVFLRDGDGGGELLAGVLAALARAS
ncbi:hypothetical protein WME88_48885 [Sorangium sp. So ce216]